ncbi:hypothetical protein QWY87_09770 [Lutimonas halocynthiae]|uniref:hypothetical protein n=1 Tax=Lutimonas halocynthiae TaxID=1446477 RepID=UPI0025B5A111|nr:hypothetical protein [Lutimonas halocynthiae]MDN3642988.1 hypothetical protein [Lutimonas halocynthiae]
MRKSLLKSSNLFFIFFIVISIQSCKVYDTGYTSEADAVASARKVKVIALDGKTYKFKKLIIEEGQLIGIAKPQSKEANTLPSEKFVDSEGHNLEKVSIKRETVKEINLYDKKKSTSRTIWLVAGLTLGIVLIAAATVTTVAVVSGV